MRKTVLNILICGILLFGITGCEEKQNYEHSFYGKILETSASYIIVEPNEDEKIRKSSDKFHIGLKNDDTTYEVGANVKITYIGGINESYPAQIGTTKIEIIENKKTKQNYTKTIDNITLEINIPNEWKYEELSQDDNNEFYKYALNEESYLEENNEFYKYALKLYKSQDNKYALLYFNIPFFVCGTLRTTKNITLDNGIKAVVGYYDGNTEWSDISFYELNSNIAIINYELESDEAEEFLDFVKTINIK